MKIDFSNLEVEIKLLEKRLATLKQDFKEAQKFTLHFLNICEKFGIKAVCIGVSNPIVKQSVDFCFGVNSSIFAEGKCEGWPAIWRAVEKAGIADGCGNTDQHQANLSKLIEGAYQFKKGKWFKVG